MDGRHLRARWNDRRFMYALYILTALLYFLAVPMRGGGGSVATAANTSEIKMHAHVPCRAVNGHGRLYS
jgi:hypothetical protein